MALVVGFPRFNHRLSKRSPITFSEEGSCERTEIQPEAIERSGLATIITPSLVNKGSEVLLARDQKVYQNLRKTVAQFVRITRLIKRGSGPEFLNSSRIPK